MTNPPVTPTWLARVEYNATHAATLCITTPEHVTERLTLIREVRRQQTEINTLRSELTELRKTK